MTNEELLERKCKRAGDSLRYITQEIEMLDLSLDENKDYIVEKLEVVMFILGDGRCAE